MKWVPIAQAEELSPGFNLRTHGRRRYVLAIIDGKISAFSPACPHAGGPLEFAETNGQVITCPLHGWSFDLAQDGCELHGFRPLRMFEVKVENGTVHVAFTAEKPSTAPDETAS